MSIEAYFQCSHCHRTFEWNSRESMSSNADPEIEVRTLESRYCDAPRCLEAEATRSGVSLAMVCDQHGIAFQSPVSRACVTDGHVFDDGNLCTRCGFPNFAAAFAEDRSLAADETRGVVSLHVPASTEARSGAPSAVIGGLSAASAASAETCWSRLAIEENAARDQRARDRVADVIEAVNHPVHYGGDTVYEVIKVLRAWGLDRSFELGNAVKYIARAGKKDAAKLVEDLKKARWYLDSKIQEIESSEKSTKERP